MRAAAVVAVIAGGCWTSSAPPHAETAAVPSIAASTGPAPAAAPITCLDAAIVLRGPVVHEDEEAAPAKQRAIEAACRLGRWPAPVLECVGRGKSGCLLLLTKVQRRQYNEQLETWESSYPESSFEPLDVDP